MNNAIRGFAVLAGAGIVMCLSLINGFLMAMWPDRFNGQVLWPRGWKVTASWQGAASNLTRRGVRVFGITLALASAFVLLDIIGPVIAVLFSGYSKR